MTDYIDLVLPGTLKDMVVVGGFLLMTMTQHC